MRIIFLIAVLLFTLVSALACSCISTPPPPEKLQKASAVFVGKVTSIRNGLHTRTFKFQIHEAFKGDLKSKVLVSSNKDGAACGVSFSEEKTYLVYTYGDIDDLRTNICSANQDADSPIGQKEIEALRALKN